MGNPKFVLVAGKGLRKQEFVDAVQQNDNDHKRDHVYAHTEKMRCTTTVANKLYKCKSKGYHFT